MAIENLPKEHDLLNRERSENIDIESEELMEKIVEDLNPTSFTLEEIQESFNVLTKEKHLSFAKPTRYSQKHLDYLVNKGLIDFDDESKTYYVIGNPDKYSPADKGR